MNDRSDSGSWIRAALQRYEKPLLRYASQILGDEELARDVVQDTFLRLCREEPDRIADHLAEWLYTVCRNRSLDVLRKEKRMKTMSDEQVATQQSRDENQVVAAETRDSAQRVQQIVEGLSDNQREVVRLKFQHGLTYREISKITKLSISNVGYLIHTALDKVRRELDIRLDPSTK